MSSLHRLAALTAAALLGTAASVAAATPAAAATTSDFSATFTTAPSTISTSQTATYVVAYTNAGPDRGGTHLEIAINGPVASVTTPSGCTLSAGNNLQCAPGVGAGETRSETFTVTPSGPGTISLIAHARPQPQVNDPDSSNNVDTAETTVTAPLTDIAIGLAAAPGPLLTSSIDYDLTASNQGPGDVTNATIDVQLPSQTVSVSNISAGCSYDPSSDQVRCATGAIANAADTVKSFQANLGLLSIGPLTATASLVSSNPADPNGANDAASADCTVLTSLIITCS